jgi:hypothetical protein
MSILNSFKRFFKRPRAAGPPPSVWGKEFSLGEIHPVERKLVCKRLIRESGTSQTPGARMDLRRARRAARLTPKQVYQLQRELRRNPEGSYAQIPEAQCYART